MQRKSIFWLASTQHIIPLHSWLFMDISIAINTVTTLVETEEGLQNRLLDINQEMRCAFNGEDRETNQISEVENKEENLQELQEQWINGKEVLSEIKPITVTNRLERNLLCAILPVHLAHTQTEHICSDFVLEHYLFSLFLLGAGFTYKTRSVSPIICNF